MQLVAAHGNVSTMSYGSYLEKRKFGTYYFRQTAEVNGKQVVRRVSLRTKDLRLAKFLALQMKARAAMINPHDVRKYEVEWDENQNIKRVKVSDDADARNLQAFMTLTEFQRAEKHKRELELKRFESELDAKERAAFAESAQGQELLALHTRLLTGLPEKTAKSEISATGEGESLKALLQTYLDDMTVKSGTLYKYRTLIEKLIAFGSTRGVTTAAGLTRSFVNSYRLHLKNDLKKEDSTIKNMFNTLSSFFNYLKASGAAATENPFIGHKLKVKDSSREPFTYQELEKIFGAPSVLQDPQMFFICLLLLTTGARPNEICQLWTDDFDLKATVPTLRITANATRDQSLKTDESERTIYVHDLVIRAGIADYLSARPLGMAFSLSRPKDKTYSTFISERFSATLKELGIAGKTMYCFRHTATTQLKNAGVGQETREDLAGHAGTGTNAAVYSQNHKPTFLSRKTTKALAYKEVTALQTSVAERRWQAK